MQAVKSVATMPCTVKKNASWMPIKTCYSTSTEVGIHDPFCTKGFLAAWAKKKHRGSKTATSRKFVDPETTWTCNIHRFKPLILKSFFSVFCKKNGWKIQDRQYKMKPTYCSWHTLSFFYWQIFVVHIFTKYMVKVPHFQAWILTPIV